MLHSLSSNHPDLSSRCQWLLRVTIPSVERSASTLVNSDDNKQWGQKITFDNPNAGGSNEFNNGPIVERLGLH